MVKITRLNGSTTDITELSYNGLGQLIQIKDTGTVTRDRYYLWCEGRICEERDQNNAVTRRFSEHGYRVEGGSPASYFYTRDHLGSVREITNSSGTVVARYEYDPFGKLTQTLGTVAPPFGYAGYFYHAETGLNLTYYRAYDPRIGRWLTRDPIGERGGQNLYGYVGNSPSNAVDPLGLIPLDTIWDAANVVYDLITGDHEAAAIDAASMIVPYVPAGGSKACKAVEEIGEYLIKEAPKYVQPGIEFLEGVYKSSRGRIEPWKAYYDEFGRLIARTDYNAGDIKQGIPDTHYHVYEWRGQHRDYKEILQHVAGEYIP